MIHYVKGGGFIASMAALCAAMVACGGGGGGGGGTGASYTVGGNIAGLLSGGLVLSDGTSTVSPSAGAGTFSFPDKFSGGSTYSITIQTQPAGLTCTISNGTGQIGSASVNSVGVVCPTPWIWQGGAVTAKVAGTYGSKGSAAAGNAPGSRDGGATWSDSDGNLWLFGGVGYDSTNTEGYLNDLWKYSTATGQWTWVSGSNVAGAAGSYGAQGTAASGNSPGARQGAVTWIDSGGNLWLFGGFQQQTAVPAGFFNDLWKYSPASNLWVWVSGSDTVNAPSVFGVQGSAAAGNIPAGRAGAVSWKDQAGNLWLFGGSIDNAAGSPSGPNDLWKYAPQSNQWTWVGGSMSSNAAGIYGTIGSAATTNAPGARDGAVAWVDGSGDFWLFGGLGFDKSRHAGGGSQRPVEIFAWLRRVDLGQREQRKLCGRRLWHPRHRPGQQHSRRAQWRVRVD